MTTRPRLAAGLVLAAAGPLWAAEPTPLTASAGRLRDIAIVAPDGEPRSLVVYLSDRSGWAADDDRNVAAMRAAGSAVLPVDFSVYAKALDGDPGDCVIASGEALDLAKTAERSLGLQTYLPPVLAGNGEGGTWAYATVAQAAQNTLAGAVALNFSARLDLRLPMCAGVAAAPDPDGRGFVYGFDREPTGPSRLFPTSADAPRFAAAAAGRSLVTVTALDPERKADQLAQAVSSIAQAAGDFGGLPVVDVPAKTAPRALAVLVSGDGGWRDLDKSVSEELAAQGVHVVGLNSLSYFWSKRSPADLGRDLSAILSDADPTGRLPVILIGYSFGADTVPFAFPLLPQEQRDRTKLIALLAPGRTTSFQVTIGGWLGIDDSGYDIVPAIAALPASRTLCVYGADDADASCADPRLAAVPQVKTVGGHHFDDDYAALAQRLLGRL